LGKKQPPLPFGEEAAPSPLWGEGGKGRIGDRGDRDRDRDRGKEEEGVWVWMARGKQEIKGCTKR
jgi:hypothetical protein